VSGFIDIHSHVLYGLDDGAKTVEDSLGMLEIAAASGTAAIVATPHANGEFPFRPDAIARRMAELQPQTGVTIHPGCDFHLHASNIGDALQHPDKYTINHGNYLLVEFPEMSKFRVAGEIFRQLLDAGLIPIISHPERNAHLRGQLDDLAAWIQDGCYLQVTAASFTGLFGADAKRSAWQLAERGMVHFVASDAHDTKRRTPNLRDAWNALADRFGDDAAEPLFVTNPADVLRNDIVDAAMPQTSRARRQWWQFWKA